MKPSVVFKVVGGRIASVRNRRGLSVSELAIASGLDEAEITRIEDGGRKLGLKELDLISRALGVSRFFLVTGITKEQIDRANAILDDKITVQTVLNTLPEDRAAFKRG
ncbi:MAG: helix-turn-helix transcriptional regulator [Rickettsiales bacterium]|jgi:transcriptional regulator with XRE-family HTH domain|nr:helix-turn-helix transcriptional regulator [Rickettsiales bacterium]